MDVRTDRVGLLLEQLQASLDTSRDRLDGLTDEEYQWEPAPGAWSIRGRGQSATCGAHGPGEWLLDGEIPEPRPAPATTIAWRIGRLAETFAGRWEWTFGPRSVRPDKVVDFSPSAARALDQLWFEVDRWIKEVDGLTDEQLDTAGFGRYPWGWDSELPIITIVGLQNRQFIHHMAQVALLRDLWRLRGA